MGLGVGVRGWGCAEACRSSQIAQKELSVRSERAA